MAADNGLLLALDKVNVFYGAIHALRDVSLTVRTGEVVTLLGANGAGKSTTLRAITGLLTPKSGRISFDGADITGSPAHKLVARGMSMSPEGRGVFANLTVLENLEMGAYLTKDKAAIKRDLERGFTLFPRLRERIRQRAGTLSGGEQQMLAIARGLMARPKLLLIDEASLGLSPVLTNTVFEVVDKINDDGTTVFMVEQNAGVLGIADKAYVMEKGTLIFTGKGDEIMKNEEIREVYLGA